MDEMQFFVQLIEAYDSVCDADIVSVPCQTLLVAD